MSDKSIESVIQKIKKLLAMAEHRNSNPNESARAASMAAKLMEQYSIDHEDVIKAELEKGDNLSDSILFNRETISWPRWMNVLAVSVASLFECKVNYKSLSGRKKTIIVMGYDADVMMVKWMYEFLHDDLLRQAERHANSHSGNKRTLKASFLSGAVRTIDDRFKEIIAERERKNAVMSSNTSLMVIKEDAINKKFGIIKYKNSKGTYADPTAYNAGVRAGNNVNINRPLGDGEKQKAFQN